jgi:hypothetical protein
MDLSESILGHYTAGQLQARIATPILRIGRDAFTRAQLAGVECFNYLACSLLTHALEELKVKDTAQLFEQVSPQALALPRLGKVSLAVLGAAFQAKGIGGSTPLATWVKKHLDKTVTFDSIKHQAAIGEADERRAEKRRKHARRNLAHAKRVDRFVERSAAH